MKMLAKKQTGGKTTTPKNKTVRLKEDSKNYLTKIKTDDKGDVSSIKVRRTVKGLLTGAPKPSMMKKGGAIKKYQPGGGTAGVRDTYPPATNKSYMPTTPAPAFKKGGAKHPGFKAVQASIAKKSGVSAKAAGAILASASRKASPAAKRANPKLKKVKG